MSTLDKMIRIGTLAGKDANTANYIRSLLPHGFESFQINCWEQFHNVPCLFKLADEVRAVLDGHDAIVSSLGVFGNPLGDKEINEVTRKEWARAIEAASAFGTNLVVGFSGRVVDKPVPESIPRLKEVFGPLLDLAASKGVRIAFENCTMDGDWKRGDWNIAFNPDAWELIFDALPAGHLGLEWEPCHQMSQLIDPVPQLREWVHKVFHVHGKDGSIYRDVIARNGISGGQPWFHHRTPGFGDTNWTDVISILRAANYSSTIDIEGWHDPVYRGELEMVGQLEALRYLKQCRGGSFLPIVEWMNN